MDGQVVNQKWGVRDGKKFNKSEKDTYKFIANHWTPASMEAKVEKEADKVSNIRMSIANTESIDH